MPPKYSPESTAQNSSQLLNDNAPSYGSTNNANTNYTQDSPFISRDKGSIRAETKVFFKTSSPLIISFFLQYSLTVASVFSVGHLGNNELASVSLASMTANITGYALIHGIATCLDTLCAQAYGRKDYKMVGVHFLRCTILELIIYLFIAFFWIFLSKPILYLLIPEHDLCDLASKYLKILSIGLPGYIIFENSKHYLQAQGIFHASTYVLFIAAPINAILNYVLVWNKHIGLGFIGAPIAVVITDYICCTCLLLYIFFVDGYQCWYVFNPKTFEFKLRHWTRMIKLAASGIIMIEAEWMAYEILTLAASRLGKNELAAQSVVTTISGLVFQFPFSMGVAISTRVANLIGETKIHSAKKASYVAISYSAILGLICAILLVTFRRLVGLLFTSDPDVLRIVMSTIPACALLQINDFICSVSGGVLRGQGRQDIAGYANMIAYYLISLPVAFLLAFKYKWRLAGLWAGLVVAVFIVSIVQCLAIIKSNWVKIVETSISDSTAENEMPPSDSLYYYTEVETEAETDIEDTDDENMIGSSRYYTGVSTIDEEDEEDEIQYHRPLLIHRGDTDGSNKKSKNKKSSKINIPKRDVSRRPSLGVLDDSSFRGRTLSI